MTFLQILHGRLEDLVYRLTDNFCYGCYKVVRQDACPNCGTDDFMRHLEGVGVEYGCDWVIRHWVRTLCTPIDGDEMYEDLLDECYPEVRIGQACYCVSQVLKAVDPVAFGIGAQENLDCLAQDDQLYECDGDYYAMTNIERMIDDLEAQA